MSIEERTAVVFDKHPLWVKALCDLLGELGLQVVGAATSVEKACALVRQHAPDIVIAEFESDEQRESDMTLLMAAAREKNVDVKCMAISGDGDLAQVERAFAAGATVCCLKTAATDDFAFAIRQMFERSIFFGAPRDVVQFDLVYDYFAASTRPKALTKREAEILELVADGGSNAEVAKALWVTEQTVKFHLSNIYRKLNVSNRTEASRWARANGLLEETVTTGSPRAADEPSAIQSNGQHALPGPAPAGDVIELDPLRLRSADEKENETHDAQRN